MNRDRSGIRWPRSGAFVKALALGITIAAIPLASSAQSVQELQKRALERQRLEEERLRAVEGMAARIQDRFETFAVGLILAQVDQGLKLKVLDERDPINYAILYSQILFRRFEKPDQWSHWAGKTIGGIPINPFGKGSIALFFYPKGGRDWVDLRLEYGGPDPTGSSGCMAKIITGILDRRGRTALDYKFACETDIFAERKGEINAALESALKAALSGRTEDVGGRRSAERSTSLSRGVEPSGRSFHTRELLGPAPGVELFYSGRLESKVATGIFSKQVRRLEKRVLAEEELDGEKVIKMWTKVKSEFLTLEEYTDYVTVDGRWVARDKGAGRERVTPPVVLLQEPLSSGAQWESPAGRCSVERMEEITIYAGKFNALRRLCDWSGGVQSEEWLSPGLGMIKSLTTTREGRLSYELYKIKRPKVE